VALAGLQGLWRPLWPGKRTVWKAALPRSGLSVIRDPQMGAAEEPEVPRRERERNQASTARKREK
jgi:hypothetical protein